MKTDDIDLYSEGVRTFHARNGGEPIPLGSGAAFYRDIIADYRAYLKRVGEWVDKVQIRYVGDEITRNLERKYPNTVFHD